MRDFASYHSPTRAKILIWVKTYPQLSLSYNETVCTGGTLEDGRMVRIYPLPLRYLDETSKFKKYQWISAVIWRAENDPRPESYRIDYDSIVPLDSIETDDGWSKRARHVFKEPRWIYSGMEALRKANIENGTSIGFVRPAEVDYISFVPNEMSEEEFFEKYNRIEMKKSQLSAFADDPRDILKLDYVNERIKIHWFCHDSGCKGHFTSLFDWEAYELRRKHGDEKVESALMTFLNTSTHDPGFFLGNTLDHQRNFSIGGIWRPKRAKKSALPMQTNIFD